MQNSNSLSKRMIMWSLAIFVAAFFLRVDYRLKSVDEEPLRADAAQYFVIALNVVKHATFSIKSSQAEAPPPDSYRGPLYPLLIAGLMAGAGEGDMVGSAYNHLLFLQAILGALAAALVFILGSRWLPFGAALTGGALMAAWPLLITMAGLALTETVFGLGLVTAVALHAAWVSQEAWWRLVLAAVAWSVCILLNPIAAPLPFLVILLARKKRASRLALFLVIALTPQLLWSARSAALVEDNSAPSSSSRLLENILIGMEPDFNDFYQRPGVEEGLAARRRVTDFLNKYYKGDRSIIELSYERFWQDPVGISLHFLGKPWDFWRWEVEQGYGGPYVYRMLSSPFDYSPPYVMIVRLTYWINPVLFIFSFIPCAALLVSRRWRQWTLSREVLLVVLGIMLYATAVHTMLTPDARYAAPFRPFQFLCAAWGGWILVDILLQRLGVLSGRTRSEGAGLARKESES